MADRKPTKTKVKGKVAAEAGLPRSRARGCALRSIQLSFVAGLALLGLGVVAGVACVIGYRQLVIANPGPQIDRDHIRTIISQESPVYYRDGTTRIGVFFEAEHRQFVPFEEFPHAYVIGIVAAEDGHFWTHHGVNPKGIVRAMRDNVLAGGLVAGGSTLTQQTAKNLYYRPDRTARSKGVELLNALRLEAHFDKSEILEFYANQFHVTGNGRGLGIAARHFFDKDPSDLTLAECAFMAGLVKGPSNYDPFLGDEARRARAVVRAHERTRYVLRRMIDEPIENIAGPRTDDAAAYERQLLEAGQIRAEAQRLLDDGFELPFRRGTFRYESSAVLDEVAKRLSEAPFDRILGDAGITDATNSGLVVVTTLDAPLQREATWALWHHLTEVGTWLEKLGPAAYVLEGHRGPRFDPDFPPTRHEFRVGRIVEHVGDAGKKSLQVDLGGHRCDVDRDGVIRVAVASHRAEKEDSGAKAPSAVVDAWVDALPDQSVVLVSVREVATATAPAKCDLEVRPELQGAVVALQDGEIRAMVGGNDNRNFNRVTALRQFGSTWKPLVYHAALRLGWSPDDLLDNTRNVFPFSTTFYYPRPDHEPGERVSMAWAGVNSENLASIWLLYHLTDRLDGEQVRSLATSLDLARRADETEEAYRTRIQELGVLPTRDRVEEALFLQSRQEVLYSLSGARHPEDALALQSMLFGWGFAAERNRASREGASTREWKERALDNDWQTMRDRVSGCRFAYGALADALEDQVAPDPDVVRELSVWLDGQTIRVGCGAIPEGYVAPDADFVNSVPWPSIDEPVVELSPDTELAPTRERRRPRRVPRLFGGTSPEPTAEAAPTGPQLVDVEDLRIDDRVHLSTLEAVGASIDRRRLTVEINRPDLYDPELLYWHQDFRLLLAMRYVSSLALDFGVQTEIQQVLAMPLGASEITLEEATSLYAGLVTGTGWQFPGRVPGGAVEAVPTSTLLILELRDVDGNVLYRAEPLATVVSEPEIGDMTADILRNVVLHGTGRRASSAVPHGSLPLPVGGKTGTTNDFRNAAFVGFAPSGTVQGYALQSAATIGAYVGYDDNRPMTAGRIRLAGASGALPAWIGTASGWSTSSLSGVVPAVVPESGIWEIGNERGLVRTTVEPELGLPDPAGTATILTRSPSLVAAPQATLIRLDRPPRLAPGTEDALLERPERPPRLLPPEMQD